MTTENDNEHTPDATDAFGPAVEDDYLDRLDDEEHDAEDPVTGANPGNGSDSAENGSEEE